ncbi:MAG: Guanine deaminase, partial [Elusimicrobia bacterium]
MVRSPGPVRYRAACLSFDRKGRLFHLPDAELRVDAQGRFERVAPWRGAGRGGMRTVDRRGLLAIPGLIDAHCHLSQYPAVAADGLQLLPWLKRHIFPLERAFRGAKARALARRFFADMASCGTTTACVYTTVWKDSAELCFQEAEASGLRVIMGKVMMDRGSYDTAFGRAHPGVSRRAVSLAESEALCERWHGRDRGRLSYAFTPRFALSCSMELMKGAARLAERHGAYIQTHLAENQDELMAVRAAFPGCRNYTDVYERAGLLGPRTILAHCIWLGAGEYRRLEAR